MAIQTEPMGATERAIVVLRKEGEDMKPSDTRCHASVKKTKVNNGRCENEIGYDSTSDHWSVFCEDHIQQERTALSEGGPRVERVS